MAEATITLAGIPCQGRHGASPGEQDVEQDFSVDMEVVLEYESDSLDDTLDYRQITQLVKDVVSSTRFHLMESMAEEVARRVFELPRVVEATALVHKPGAAERMGIEDVAAEVSFEE